MSETKNLIQDEQSKESEKTVVNVEQTTQISISKQISTTTLQSSIIKKIEEETKIVKIETKQEKQHSMIVFNENSLHIGKYFGRPTYDSVKYVQEYIDNGYISVTQADIYHNDGKRATISGHNPGVFSGLAKHIEKGGPVTIIDRNGVSKTMTFNLVGKFKDGRNIPQSLWGTIHPDTGEGTIIQFCIETDEGIINTIWLGK